MDNKINNMSETVNVTLHKLTFLDKAVSYAKVKRNTAFVGNIVSKILEQNKVLDRETLLYAAGLFRNAVLELLKSGKSVDLFEMGTLYLKPSKGIDSVNPGIKDIPEMTLSFTPSALATEAVKDIAVGADVTIANEPEISELYDIHTKSSGNTLSIGQTVRITGKRLKIAGNENETGIYLAPVTAEDSYDTSESDWISLGADSIVDNTGSKILFNIPSTVNKGKYKLVIKTGPKSIK